LSAAALAVVAVGILFARALPIFNGPIIDSTPQATQILAAGPPTLPATQVTVPTPTTLVRSTPLAVAAPSPSPTKDPALALTGTIKIVSSFPRTGNTKPETDAIVNAIKQALAEVDYRIGNASITYQDLDDSTLAAGHWDATKEAENATMAANDQDVMVYVGTLDSAASAISIPILCKANLVMISPANTSPGLSKKIESVAPNEPDKYYPDGCTHNFTRVIPSSEVQGAAAAAWAKQLGASRAYVLTNEGESFGVALARTYVQQAARVGLEVVGGPDSITPSNITAVVQKIKQRDANAVFFAGSVNENVIRLWQELRKTLAPEVRLMAPSTFVVDPSFLSKTGPAAEGTFVTFPTVESRLLTGKGAGWYTRYKQQFTIEPEDYAAYAYDAITASLDAIKRAGRKDRAAIRDALFATRDFDGVLGRWSFTSTGDTTSITIGGRQVRDGNLNDASTAVSLRAD
jgi:branched-chain amino acid transport system substrate-binding protein